MHQDCCLCCYSCSSSCPDDDNDVVEDSNHDDGDDDLDHDFRCSWRCRQPKCKNAALYIVEVFETTTKSMVTITTMTTAMTRR